MPAPSAIVRPRLLHGPKEYFIAFFSANGFLFTSVAFLSGNDAIAER
jgi:hypothetical protein